MLMRFSTLLTPALIALLLTACGGDNDDDATAGSGNPGGPAAPGNSGDPPAGGFAPHLCSLLTSDEIEAAVGNPVEDGVQELGTSCIWNSDPTDTSVSVHLLLLPNADLCVGAISSDPTYVEQDSLGSPAFGSYNEALGGLADLVVCLDAGQFQLIVAGGLDDTADEERLRGAARQLAELALSRL